jgi:uncharacterized membrane protein YfcA
VDWFILGVFLLALTAGGLASVVGFGIGSILTPVLALRLGAQVAIPAVAVPHLVATFLRWWKLRRFTSRVHLLSFGLLSAAGGLGGALIYARLQGPRLAIILGAVLVLSAVARLAGRPGRWTPGRGVSMTIGGLSGFFGGVAGNQGGIRAAALSVFELPPREFVATATAVALMVDLGRTPVYVIRAGGHIRGAAGVIAVAVTGAVLGTALGERVLSKLPRERFTKVVSVAVGLLGAWLIVRYA